MLLLHVVAYILKLQMNNHQTNINPLTVSKNSPCFSIKRYFTDFFLTLIHYPNFSIITNHCINDDQHNDLCHEA